MVTARTHASLCSREVLCHRVPSNTANQMSSILTLTVCYVTAFALREGQCEGRNCKKLSLVCSPTLRPKDGVLNVFQLHVSNWRVEVGQTARTKHTSFSLIE